MLFRTPVAVLFLLSMSAAGAITLQEVRDQNQTRAPGALQSAHQLIAADPSSLTATLELAIAERRYGSIDAAVAAARSAIALDPTSMEAHL